MAKFIAVCRTDDYRFERRQLPLEVDDKLKMIVQFNDTCAGCNQLNVKQRELERFVQRFHTLSNDDIAVALMVTSREIFSFLAQLVPCVGCRRSVEKMFGELVESGLPALEPLIITKTSVMSLKREVLFDPKAIFALFYIHGSKVTTLMDSIPKSKKNRRCLLHSLDTHKTRALGSWMDVWDVLSQDCREEVVLIKCDSLMETLDNYLRKHRFCTECKAKVLRAYTILTGEPEASPEKGYCPALYDGLRCCYEQRHVHVSCETDFIARLISRAEPELTGSRRERHAKTLDIAQEEVLTCLGIHLYERLHKIWQKLRAEEQTWQILFYLGVDALRKNFEVALEKKQGISNLELMCQELLEEEQAKEQKREQKRQKRKKKKNKSKQGNDIDIENDEEKNKENCKCDENINTTSMCASCDDAHKAVSSPTKPIMLACQSNAKEKELCKCDEGKKVHKEAGSVFSGRSDCGYSSGLEGCDSCSMPSSNDGSDIACSEGYCNHEGDSPLCRRSELAGVCHECNIEMIGESCGHLQRSDQYQCGIPQCVTGGGGGGGGAKFAPSLMEMLEDCCSSGEEEETISEEEIQRFKANQQSLTSQRLELRETLRQRFASMQQRQCLCIHNKLQTGDANYVLSAKVKKVSLN